MALLAAAASARAAHVQRKYPCLLLNMHTARRMAHLLRWHQGMCLGGFLLNMVLLQQQAQQEQHVMQGQSSNSSWLMLPSTASSRSLNIRMATEHTLTSKFLPPAIILMLPASLKPARAWRGRCNWCWSLVHVLCIRAHAVCPAASPSCSPSSLAISERSSPAVVSNERTRTAPLRAPATLIDTPSCPMLLKVLICSLNSFARPPLLTKYHAHKRFIASGDQCACTCQLGFEQTQMTLDEPRFRIHLYLAQLIF